MIYKLAIGDSSAANTVWELACRDQIGPVVVLEMYSQDGHFWLDVEAQSQQAVEAACAICNSVAGREICRIAAASAAADAAAKSLPAPHCPIGAAFYGYLLNGDDDLERASAILSAQWLGEKAGRASPATAECPDLFVKIPALAQGWLAGLARGIASPAV